MPPNTASSFGGGELLGSGEIRLGRGEIHRTPWTCFAWSDAGLDGLHPHLRGRRGHPGTPRPVTLNTGNGLPRDGEWISEWRPAVSMASRRKESTRSYQYAGQYDWNTGIPANLSTPSTKDDYAKVRNSFHSNGAKKTAHYVTDSWGPAPWTPARWWRTIQLGTERDDYRLARPDLTYRAMVSSSRLSPSAMRMGDTARSYRPGTSVAAHWWAPVQHPSVAPSSVCSFCRSDVGATFDPGLGGDSDPTHSTDFGPRRAWTYYRNGEQITNPATLFVPEKADYTFVSTDTHTDSEVRLGGKAVTEYGFTSAAPKSMEAPDCTSVIPQATACEALPVIQLHYRMDASLLNEVAAGTRSTITVDASRTKGFTGDSRMAGARFSVSYDDGATWNNVDVDRADENSFKARFTNAELSGSNGYVSIKVEVWDEAGNRTVQTVTRAYALK
ncbi:hypothetical protein ACFY8X_22700 [Streptomyces tanashiensis]|uniref:hypothetical protein n=1 Tax=Streptomyces tanashiensis TaxID=67367 RepID=UPI0036EE2C7B